MEWCIDVFERKGNTPGPSCLWGIDLHAANSASFVADSSQWFEANPLIEIYGCNAPARMSARTFLRFL